MITMDRSPSTIDRYRIVSTMLKRVYLKSSSAEFHPMEFLDCSIREHLHLASSTVRQYRASLLWLFESHYPYLLNDATEKLKKFVSNNKHTRSKREKKKSYTDEEITIFLDYLSSKIKPKYSEQDVDIWENAYYTIRAGSLVGLRPSEWLHAFLYQNGEEVTLIVKNAKNTHGRSHGEYRKIDLRLLPTEDILAIENKIKLTKHAVRGGTYGTIKIYNKRVAEYLRRANNSLFPNASKTIAAYTCRHQITASLKASGASAYEIAALLGHKSIETHRLHYPRKPRSGSVSPTSILATIEDVITVTQLNPAGPRNIPDNSKPPSEPTPPSPSSPLGPKF